MHYRLKSRQNLNTKLPCTKEEQIMFLCEKDLMFICYTFGVSQNKHEIADLAKHNLKDESLPYEANCKTTESASKTIPLVFSSPK